MDKKAIENLNPNKRDVLEVKQKIVRIGFETIVSLL